MYLGGTYRPASLLVDRNGPMIKVGTGRDWEVVSQYLNTFDSMFSQVADRNTTPEVLLPREATRGCRFYDHFRTDSDAPARMFQQGTRTRALHHDGCGLANALQTVREIGNAEALDEAIGNASEATQVWVVTHANHLVAALNEHRDCSSIELEKRLGQTQMIGQGLLDEPVWHWPN